MMLAKAFALAICAVSASASVIGHQHLGHHHRASLYLAKRAESGLVFVERRFGSSGPLTPGQKGRWRQRAALSKAKFCQAPSVSSSSVAAPTSTPIPESTTVEPTTTKKTTTTTREEETTTSKKPDPTPEPKKKDDDDGGGSGSGKSYSGEITYYDPGLGACGDTNGPNDMIAAVSIPFFDGFPGYAGGNPNNNPMCGRQARVHLRGKTITVKLVDRCGACAYGDLDLTPHAFSLLADMGEGRVGGMTWELL